MSTNKWRKKLEEEAWTTDDGDCTYVHLDDALAVLNEAIAETQKGVNGPTGECLEFPGCNATKHSPDCPLTRKATP